jgi:hypothetical protein
MIGAAQRNLRTRHRCRGQPLQHRFIRRQATIRTNDLLGYTGIYVGSGPVAAGDPAAKLTLTRPA